VFEKIRAVNTFETASTDPRGESIATIWGVTWRNGAMFLSSMRWFSTSVNHIRANARFWLLDFSLIEAAKRLKISYGYKAI